MPSKRLVVVLTVTALSVTFGPVALATASGLGNAKGGGNGKGSSGDHGNKPSSTSWYGDHKDAMSCLPGADVCTATGTVDLATQALHSESTLKRTVAGVGPESTADLAYAGEYFLLRKAAKSVTVTLHLTGIRVGDQTGAQSPDNLAKAVVGVGGSITDSACPTYGCGASSAQQQVVIDYEEQLAGVTTTPATNALVVPGQGGSQPTDEVITLTLSMPDGSDLPAGTISFAGYTYTYTSLGDRQCTPGSTPTGLPGQLQHDLPSTCAPDRPHTGATTASISATVASIDYTVG